MRKNRKIKDAETDERPHKTLRRYGFEYVLVACDRASKYGNVADPTFMGENGFALQACRKLPRI